MRTTELQRARMAKRNLWGNVNVHTPEGKRCPSWLIKEVRFECWEQGGDPGNTNDVKLAILKVQNKYPEFQRSWFHFDYLARTAGRWASNWRSNTSEAFKEKLLEEYTRPPVD